MALEGLIGLPERQTRFLGRGSRKGAAGEEPPGSLDRSFEGFPGNGKVRSERGGQLSPDFGLVGARLEKPDFGAVEEANLRCGLRSGSEIRDLWVSETGAGASWFR